MQNDYNFMIKLTTLCPGNCKCCKNRLSEFKKIDHDKVYFNIDNFRKLCFAINKIGGKYIAISGGEPTIVPNLTEFIKVAHSYGLSTRINTSGFNITRNRLIEWLDAGLDQIVLSVYGVDFNTYTIARGNELMYKKGFEALKIIKEVKEEYNFIFILQTVIMKDNYRQMNDLLKLAIKCHADKFWPSYLEDAYNLPEARLDSKDVNDFRNNIKKMMVKTLNDNQLNINNNFENLNRIYEEDYINYIYHPNKFICHHPGHHLSFYPDGRIDLCCGFEYIDGYRQYVDYQGIDKILTVDFMKSFENMSFDYCKYCPQGLHQEINLNEIMFNEYEGRDCLNEKKLQKSKN